MKFGGHDMEMTRGQIQDLLTRFATQRPAYLEALERNPREVIYRQLGIQIPGYKRVQVVRETADQVYVVLPHVVDAGDELSDADLEAVAGGNELVKEASCGGGGTFQTVKSMEVSIG
jgi:hypothetical protein